MIARYRASRLLHVTCCSCRTTSHQAPSVMLSCPPCVLRAPKAQLVAGPRSSTLFRRSSMFGKKLVVDMISRSAENEPDRRKFLKTAGLAGLGVVGTAALAHSGGLSAAAAP